MKNKLEPAAKGAGHHSGCVCFGLTHPTAHEVCIAGSFNDWHPTVTPMIRLEDDRWAKELALPPGRYEYRFVVDGVWVDDPAATELIPNSFGTANAVLEVRPAIPAPSARSGAGGPRKHSVEGDSREFTASVEGNSPARRINKCGGGKPLKSGGA